MLRLVGDLAILFAGLAGDVPVLIAEPVARLLCVIPDGLGRGRDHRRTFGRKPREERLDRLAPLAGLLLDPAHQLVNVAALHLEVVIGELTPLLLHLPAEVVPLALKFLGIDRHRSQTPLSSSFSGGRYDRLRRDPNVENSIAIRMPI